MGKSDAERLHQRVGQCLERTGQELGSLLLSMFDHQGWKALGCSTFEAYLKKVENDFGGSRRSIYAYMEAARVERALYRVTGAAPKLSIKRALVLYPLLEKPDLLLEAFQEGVDAPEAKLRCVVDRLLPAPTTKKQRDKGKEGWTKEDVAEDKELRDALDKIQSVYGKEERMAIQDGIIGLPRKEIFALAKLYAPTMEKIRHLILANRWGVAESVAFANDMATDKSTVAQLKNWCLTTKGLYWTGVFDGFEITVKATTAVRRKVSSTKPSDLLPVAL
jgi:hypothetical protein